MDDKDTPNDIQSFTNMEEAAYYLFGMGFIHNKDKYFPLFPQIACQIDMSSIGKTLYTSFFMKTHTFKDGGVYR